MAPPRLRPAASNIVYERVSVAGVAADRRAVLVDSRRAFAGLGKLRVERLREAQAVPRVGVACRALEHHRTHRREHDRRARQLHRARIHHRCVDPVELSRVRRHLVHKHQVDDLEVFLQPRHPLPGRPVRDSHHLVGRVDGQPDAEPELDAPAGDMVEAERLTCEGRRIAKRDLGDARSKPQGGRRLRDGAERGPEVEPGVRRIGPVDEMVCEPAEVEPQRLNAPEAVEHGLPRRVGRDEHLETQGAGHHEDSGCPAFAPFGPPRRPRPSGPRPGGT